MERHDRALTERVRRFTLAYVELLGGSIEEVAPDLFRIELTPEQAAQLDPGAPVWLWNSHGTARSQITYYFTFTPSVAERFAEAELVSAGCHRLHQVIEGVRQRGQGARLWLPPPRRAHAFGEILFRPFLYFLLKLEYRSPGGGVRLFPVAVDRVEHLPLRQLGALLPTLPLFAGRPGAPFRIEESSLPLRAAFELAFDEAVASLESEDPAWARGTADAVAQERTRLVRYYAQKEREGEEVEPERSHRLQELEALAPKVLVRPQLVAEVYLPVAFEQGRVRHLAFAHPYDP